MQGYEQLTLLDENGYPITPNTGYVLSVSKIPGEPDEIVSDDVINEVLAKRGTIRKLRGSGEFQSPECVEYLKKCDICCTNPPFSLFADLFSLLVKYDKKQIKVIFLRFFSLKKLHILNKSHTFAVEIENISQTSKNRRL